jgi:hypothetical protein
MMRCELTIQSDSVAEIAQVASAIASATGRGVEGRPGAAASPVPGPTARDGVAGMLLRCGYRESATDLASGKCTAAETIEAIDGWPRQAMGFPRAALEALAAREACRAGHGVNDACAECAPGEQVEGAEPDREALGRAVHEVWREANELRTASSSWEAMDEETREIDRCIGERLYAKGVAAGRAEAEALRALLTEARANYDHAVEDWDKARSEAEVLRKRVAELEEELEDRGERLKLVPGAAQHARSAGAAEMRERAASLVLNWEPWESSTKLAERIRELPIGGEPTASSPGDAEVTACDGSGAVLDYGGPFDCAGCSACRAPTFDPVALWSAQHGDVRAAQDVGGGP